MAHELNLHQQHTSDYTMTPKTNHHLPEQSNPDEFPSSSSICLIIEQKEE